MQEGIISLMQMAKTSAAAKRHSEAGLLYVPEEKKRVQELLRLTRNTELCTPVHFDFNHERIVVEKKKDEEDRFQIKCYF